MRHAASATTGTADRRDKFALPMQQQQGTRRHAFSLSENDMVNVAALVQQTVTRLIEADRKGQNNYLYKSVLSETKLLLEFMGRLKEQPLM
jgi:hypothetical protein